MRFPYLDRGQPDCGGQPHRFKVVCSNAFFFFFQAEDGIRDLTVTGVQTCALPICQGAVRPSPLLHSGSQRLISITGFLWDLVLFIIASSAALSRFLHTMSAVQGNASEGVPSQEMAEAIIALARLPLYSFDEIHPFAKTRVVVSCAGAVVPRLDSGLYGTFAHRWTKSTDGRVGRFAGEYEGDGVTKTFQIVVPENLNLQHWE